MDIVSTLTGMGMDANTIALVWFAVIYQRRLTSIETTQKTVSDFIIGGGVCKK